MFTSWRVPRGLLAGIVLQFFLAPCLTADGIQEFPKGHLEPFGNHRPPDVPIDELHEIPHPQTFWDDYVSKEKPAILRGAATHSPAYHLWTEDYLREAYGDLEVRLEGKRERGSGIPVGAKGLGRDTLQNFVETFREMDTYIVSQLPEPMYSEFHVPPCIACGNMRRRVVEIDLWMSSGDTHSIIHKDAFNAINCLLRGTKQWKMVEFKYEKWLYKTWEPEREIGGNSQIDPERVDLLRYPDIANVRWSNITINAGDCLFLPKSYYHQVSSSGDPNMAVSVLFSRLSRFDPTGCEDTPIVFTPLNEVDVLWSWPGHGIMTMGNDDAWALRANYERFAEEHGQITLADLINDIRSVVPEMGDELEDYARKGWEVLDKSHKGFLTPDDLRSLDTPTLRTHVLAMGVPDPSNTEEFEYSYISVEAIEELLNHIIADYPGKVQRTLFVSLYVQLLQGTEKYAQEIFDGLAGPGIDEVTVEQVRQNMDGALQKWRDNEIPELTPEMDIKFKISDIKIFKSEL